MKMKILFPVALIVALLLLGTTIMILKNEQVLDLQRTSIGSGKGPENEDQDPGKIPDDEQNVPYDNTTDDEPDDLPDNGTNEGPVDIPDNGTIDDPIDEPDNGSVEDPVGPPMNETKPSPVEGPGNDSDDDRNPDSPYHIPGSITVETIGTFEFDPWIVETVRSDIFKGGHISLFDILVHLDEREDIDLEYHYMDVLDTNVIDSINGMEDWWYWAYYSGGWREDNAWRMDMYPYKDNTTIHVHREQASTIQQIEITFAEEVRRKENNDGRVIIPKVIIRGHSFQATFEDVEVFPHDLRSDSLRSGVITAIDVIMSLGDRGLITYELKWYEKIGSADPVLNYWVEGINDDIAYGSCGFVYETGSEDTHYRNHIHIPSDQRILVSPDYEEWFWICL